MTVPLILYVTNLDVAEIYVIELCVIELTHSSPGDSTADLLYQHDHDGGPPYPDHPDYPGYPGDQPGYLVDHPGYQAYMGEFRDEIEFNEYYQQVGRVRTFYNGHISGKLLSFFKLFNN